MINFRDKLGPAVLWLAILVLAAVVLTPGLRGGFLFDDEPNIVANPPVHISTLSFASLAASLDGASAGPLGRPISVLSFALTHYFFGLDSFAFKAVNLAIHLVNGLLVGWLVSLLLRLIPAAKLTDPALTWLPLWVAAVWLVHPINIVPVMLTVQRMTLLAGMFMLLALISHVKAVSTPTRGRAKWGWLAASWLVFWPLAVLSKETGLLFPLYILVIALLVRRPTASGGPTMPWAVLIPIVSLLLVGVAMLSFLGWQWLAGAYSQRPFTMSERLMTEGRVLWFYAGQIIVPQYPAFGLYLDDFVLSKGLLSPASTLAALLGWGGIIATAVYFRYRHVVLSLAGAWFLAGHSLESTFLPLEIAHEYRNYLPSIGLIMGVGYAGATLLARIKLDHRAATIGITAAVPLLVLALFTWLRADQLGNPLIGPQIEAARHPQSARANHTAALAMIRARYGDAGDPIVGHSIRYHLERSSMVDASFKLGDLALIVWACASGRPVESAWLSRFAERLERTPFAPKDFDLPGDLLKPLLHMPNCIGREDTLRLFTAGSRNRLVDASIHARFLDSAADYELLVSHDPSSARTYLEQAVALQPKNDKLRQKLDGFQFQPPATRGKQFR